MQNSWRTIRARALTPDRKSVRLVERGFHVKDETARAQLESVGGTFLTGFRHALEAPGTVELASRLDGLDRSVRGFGYEGAAMALAVLDGLTPVAAGRTRRFLDGPAAPHVYMAYVGVGWALAKLPRWRRSALAAPDPLLRWLAVDGYGFHEAYFRTDRCVHRQEVADPGWPGGAAPAERRRVFDQGVGRAMWFVAGADPHRVADLIGRFAGSRQPDLWSGTGLAATYAGAADEDELAVLLDRAGPHRAQLAQGAAFAARARLRAGLVTAHTPVATRVLCGCSPEQAAGVTDEARRDLPADGPQPAYEVWRQRVQSQFRLARR